MNKYFLPLAGGTRQIAVTSTSTNMDFAFSSMPASALLLANVGSSAVFVKTGTSAQTATTADMPLAANTTMIVNRPENHVNIGAVCSASGTSFLNFTLGY